MHCMCRKRVPAPACCLCYRRSSFQAGLGDEQLCGALVGLGNANVCGSCSATVSTGICYKECAPPTHVSIQSHVVCFTDGVKKTAAGAGCSQLTQLQLQRSQSKCRCQYIPASSDMLLMHLTTPPKQVVLCAHAQQPGAGFLTASHTSAAQPTRSDTNAPRSAAPVAATTSP